MANHFMPGAAIHVVPGIGTFGVFAVASGRGSEGLQFQFMPEGGSERLPGVLSFKVSIGDDRVPSIHHVERGSPTGIPGRLQAEPAVIEAAGRIATEKLATDVLFVLFNLLAVAQTDMDAIAWERRMAEMRVRSLRYRLTQETSQIAAGGNEPPTVDEDRCLRAEEAMSRLIEGTEERLAMLKSLRRDLVDWSGTVNDERQDLFDLVRHGRAPDGGLSMSR